MYCVRARRTSPPIPTTPAQRRTFKEEQQKTRSDLFLNPLLLYLASKERCVLVVWRVYHHHLHYVSAPFSSPLKDTSSSQKKKVKKVSSSLMKRQKTHTHTHKHHHHHASSSALFLPNAKVAGSERERKREKRDVEPTPGRLRRDVFSTRAAGL